MFQIIVTDDFIDVIKDLSLKDFKVLSKSFISVERINDKQLIKEDFMERLLEQVKNQELE